MITGKDLNTRVIENFPNLKGGFEPFFGIFRQSLTGKRSEPKCRYTLTYILKMIDDRMPSTNNTRLQVACEGYFDLDKTIGDLTVGDLYQCIVLATNEITKTVKGLNLNPPFDLVPPQRMITAEKLQKLLNKYRFH